MTLNLRQLRVQVAERFKNVEQVDDSVVRFMREAEGNVFAVYYLDVDGDLPNSAESLSSYQDRVIGRRYFDGRRSL
jgi:hypothetical protein